MTHDYQPELVEVVSMPADPGTSAALRQAFALPLEPMSYEFDGLLARIV